MRENKRLMVRDPQPARALRTNRTWPSKNPNSIAPSGQVATPSAAAYVLVLLFIEYVFYDLHPEGTRIPGSFPNSSSNGSTSPPARSWALCAIAASAKLKCF